ARPAALPGPQPHVHDRARRADAASAGVGRAPLRHVGEAPSRRNALAGDPAQLVRRRVLDLPAAPVLPDDSRGVPRRGARRRPRRAARAEHGGRATREAGDRGGRTLLVPLHVQRLLPAAPLYGREPAQLAAADRALAVPLAAPGAVEPDDGGDAARDGARDRDLLPRAEGLRRGRHAHRGQRMKLAVIGAGSTYTPELVSHLSELAVDEVALHDIDAERLGVVGGLAERMLGRAGYSGSLLQTGDFDAAVDGASFVLLQLRVGGQAARLQDETVPLLCSCIGQETTGAGGFDKAMR